MADEQVTQSLAAKMQGFTDGLSSDEKTCLSEMWQKARSTVVSGDVQGYQLGAYTIQPGDTLSGISYKVFGDASLWPLLYWANSNQIANPNLIFPGQRIVV